MLRLVYRRDARGLWNVYAAGLCVESDIILSPSINQLFVVVITDTGHGFMMHLKSGPSFCTFRTLAVRVSAPRDTLIEIS